MNARFLSALERYSSSFLKQPSVCKNWLSDIKPRVEEIAQAGNAERYRLAAHHLGYNFNTASHRLSRLQADILMPWEYLQEHAITGDRALIDEIRERWTPSERTLEGRNACHLLFYILDLRFAPGVLAANLCHDSVDILETAARVESWKRRITETEVLIETTAQLEADSEEFKHLLLQEKQLSPIIKEIQDEIHSIFETMMPGIKLYWGSALDSALYGLDKVEVRHA